MSMRASATGVQDTSNVMGPTLTVDGMPRAEATVGAGVVAAGVPLRVHPTATANTRREASPRRALGLNGSPGSV